MSQPADPNIKYAPQPYPAMRYATRDQYVIVHDEAEDAAASAKGYGLLKDVTAAPVDGLDVRTQEELVDISLRLLRSVLARTPRENLIRDIRAMRDAVTAPASADEPALEAMADDALRALIEKQTGNAPRHRTGRDKLLLQARAALGGE